MGMLAVVCLAIVWACFLVPPMLRKHREGRPASSVVSFRRQLSTLERATPGTSLRPIPYRPAPVMGTSLSGTSRQLNRSQVVRRRQNILFALAGSTAFTMLLLVIAPGALTFLLFLATGGAFAAYVYALVQLKTRADEAAAKVRVLRPQPAPRAARTPVIATRRTASN